MASSLFEKDLAAVINRHSIDAACSTPDFILARLLANTIASYRQVVCWGGMWHSPEGVPEAFREDGPPIGNFNA